ncbi:MAG: hypothetical protein ACKOXT_04920 [Actinomycetota bacterium]
MTQISISEPRTRFHQRGENLVNLEQVNLLRVQPLSEPELELTKPLFGRDFVAGFSEGSSHWCLMKRDAIQSLEFCSRSDAPDSKIVWSRKAIGETLSGFDFPAECSISFYDSKIGSLRVFIQGVFRGFLVADQQRPLAIPISTISSITFISH